MIERREPRFLLMYPPLQFRPEDAAKPDGSLGIAYLAGALRRSNFDVSVLDACVGAPGTDLGDSFFRTEKLESGLVRIGMSSEAIARAVEPYDVIGITSIFTAQTSRVQELIRTIKSVDENKLVILGGVNARYLSDRFFEVGADIICLSESEETIVEIGKVLRNGSQDFSRVRGIEMIVDGKQTRTAQVIVQNNLDDLPIPALDMLPFERYWKVARPHGGGFKPENGIRYASLMTSRGCPFKCTFCHISKEVEGSIAGNIRSLRMKSIDRVEEEIENIRTLGADYVFLEDDTLLAKKKRAQKIFSMIASYKLSLSDVNGVNIVHLFKKHKGKMVVDDELIGGMAEAGFKEITLPFESGSQRIIDRYATGKLDLALDMNGLIRAIKDFGLNVGGNYTFGYPDETYDELTETLLLARSHMDAGLDRANLMIIVPFPGTELYDQAIRDGHLSPDFDPDSMNWMYPTMSNTVIHPEVLRYVNRALWLLLNKSARIQNISSMALTELQGIESSETVVQNARGIASPN